MWKEAVHNLIYLLETYGGFWLRDSRCLVEHMARLPVNPKELAPLEHEQEVLTDVIRTLATIYNCPKANLSEVRQQQLRDVLRIAITQANKRKKEIPVEIESRDRAVENIRRRMMSIANSADDEVKGRIAKASPGEQTMNDAATSSTPAHSGKFSLIFEPGFLVCRMHREPLRGKPLQVLKALWESPKKTLTLDALQRKVWPDSTTGQETVRSAISAARKAVARAYEACKIVRPEDAVKTWPISLVDRGQGLTAWRLDLP